MGLDVYLYRYEDFENGVLAEQKFQAQTEHLWGNGISKESRTAAMAALASGIGLNAEGECTKEKIEIPSGKYPDHYFKVGYLRSSYNDAGINSVLRSMGMDDLYWVFDPRDRYEFVPDWQQSKTRIAELLEKYREAKAGWRGEHTATFVGPNIFASKEELPQSSKEALDSFGTELSRKAGFDSYSNRKGIFFKKAENLVAAIPGVGSLGNVGVYLIFSHGQEPTDWYGQAIEITQEMIDYVLAQPEPQKYALHWSS